MVPFRLWNFVSFINLVLSFYSFLLFCPVRSALALLRCHLDNSTPGQRDEPAQLLFDCVHLRGTQHTHAQFLP
jgi:hypothetical protein